MFELSVLSLLVVSCITKCGNTGTTCVSPFTSNPLFLVTNPTGPTNCLTKFANCSSNCTSATSQLPITIPSLTNYLINYVNGVYSTSGLSGLSKLNFTSAISGYQGFSGLASSVVTCATTCGNTGIKCVTSFVSNPLLLVFNPNGPTDCLTTFESCSVKCV